MSAGFFRYQQHDFAVDDSLRPLGMWGRVDWIAPLCILALSALSLLFIYSVESYRPAVRWQESALIKQAVFMAIGGALYVIVSLTDYRWWLQRAHWIYLIGILLLLLLETPLGVERYNARRWLNFGVVLLQPSEFAKIGLLVFVASLLHRSEVGALRQSLGLLGKVTLAVLVPFCLIFKQPDLGSAMVVPPMAFALLFISHLPKRFIATALIGIMALGGILAVDLYRYYNYFTQHTPKPLSFSHDRGKFEASGQALLPLKDYQRNRILTFVAPEAIDPNGKGERWNSLQSEIAVASGGLTGKGHAQGTQARYGYLPQAVAHNDFIFSVIAEESGFVGGLTVIILTFTLILNSLRIAFASPDRFGQCLAVGVAAIFLVHAFVNIGMTIGIMPVKGIPLPFLSYGGSFVLSCCVLQGLVQSVHRHRREFS